MSSETPSEARRIIELESELRKVRADRDRLARELAALRTCLTTPAVRQCRDPHAL